AVRRADRQRKPERDRVGLHVGGLPDDPGRRGDPATGGQGGMPAVGRGGATLVDARRACRSPGKAAIISLLPSSRRRGDGMTSDELTTALGQAAASVWGRLPVHVQHYLFEAAVRSAGR